MHQNAHPQKCIWSWDASMWRVNHTHLELAYNSAEDTRERRDISDA